MTRVDLVRLLLIPILLASLAPPALAQSAEAEVLFRDGRRLIKAGQLETGCAKLEASSKLEASVGTLLNLGDCREKLGDYASAWAAFRSAEAMAKRRGGDEKRRNEASKRAIILEPKLSNLVLVVTPKIDGLVIKRDDEVIDPVIYSTPIPLDPDTYTIVAEAPGYKAWKTQVTIAKEKKRTVVTVPALEKELTARAPEKLGPTDLPPVVVAPPPQRPIVVEKRRSEPSIWTTTRKVSLGLAVAGVAATGTGLYFGMRARELEDRSNELCPRDVCDDPIALGDNDRAQTAARNANIAFAVGGVALATSVVLWFVGAPSEETVVTPTAGRDYAGVSLGGTF